MLPLILASAMLLVVIALVVERQVVTRAPREAERRLEAWLGVPITVVAAGRPRDWLRSRAVPVVSLAADHLPIQQKSVVIDRLEVELVGVQLVGRGDDRRILASAGSFRATLGQQAVRQLVDLPPLVRRVDLTGDRVRLITSAGLNIDLQLYAERGAIMLKPTGNPLDVFLPLRHRIAVDLPAGATVERVAVRAGVVELSGPIDGAKLTGD